MRALAPVTALQRLLLSSLNGLAGLLLLQGLPAEAVQVYREALAISERFPCQPCLDPGDAVQERRPGGRAGMPARSCLCWMLAEAHASRAQCRGQQA